MMIMVISTKNNDEIEISGNNYLEGILILFENLQIKNKYT